MNAAPEATLRRVSVLDEARNVIRLESEAVAALATRLDARFERAVELLIACHGRVVVTGLGKSGAVGRKIASTLASTGTPALFLHAAEGLHGDLGMIAPGDVLIALSYSGRTSELTSILPVAHDMGVSVIALTGNEENYLARHADIVLDVHVEREACPLNLAPTTSIAAMLAIGDALAICAMRERQFTHEDFARFHPGGALGPASKLRVADLMRTGDRVAIVTEATTVRDALEAITTAGAGAVLAVDKIGHLSGYLTDGDVRRAVVRAPDANALLNAPIAPLLTRHPLTLSPAMPAIEALRALQERGVDDAPVVDEIGHPAGVLDVQELLRAGLS